MPTIQQLKEEPEHCVAKACSGNTFDMKVRDIVACENTFIMSIMCYIAKLYGPMDKIKTKIDGISFESITLADMPRLIKMVQEFDKPEYREVLEDPGVKAVIKAHLAKQEPNIKQVARQYSPFLPIAKNAALFKAADFDFNQLLTGSLAQDLGGSVPDFYT
uniref:BTB domain-containing protein n=1 Tax=Panagrellus redivivus TaxID=6233 RepID=A0A7E4ZUQ5_PANRE